ncbi:hypothetical protein VL806_10495 [Listeria seeligeri]|uniref:hypothetical protein n=1 Tax=Listeria seeligeri TaxID=1640 RepID=UPI0018B0D153|nr:hypothetical protein [Listeria seeligeri]QPJ27195.1 hypothetical protein IMX23_03280 [Listeria seeligeri]
MRKLGVLIILFWMACSYQADATEIIPPMISLENEQTEYTAGDEIHFRLENAEDLKIVLINEQGQKRFLKEPVYTVSESNLDGSYRAELYQKEKLEPVLVAEDLFQVKQLDETTPDDVPPSFSVIDISHDTDILPTNMLHVSIEASDDESGVKAATLIIQGDSNKAEIQLTQNIWTEKWEGELALTDFQLGEKITFAVKLMDFADNEITVDTLKELQLYQPKAPTISYNGMDILAEQKKIVQVGDEIELTLDKYATEFPTFESESGKIIPLNWQKNPTGWQGSLTLTKDLVGEIIQIPAFGPKLLIRTNSTPFYSIELIKNTILTGIINEDFATISQLYIDVNGSRYAVMRDGVRFTSEEITTTGNITLYWTDWDGQIYSEVLVQKIKPILPPIHKEIITSKPVISKENQPIFTTPAPKPENPVKKLENTSNKPVKKENKTTNNSSSIPFWIPSLIIIGIIIFSGNKAMK